MGILRTGGFGFLLKIRRERRGDGSSATVDPMVPELIPFALS